MAENTLARYRLGEKVGEGASGIVYKAEDLVLGRAVALKMLPPELASDASALLRFQHEVRIASSLNHPNICTVHDISEEHGHHFIVMELLEGALLSESIAGGALALDRILEIGLQLADALDAAHGEGVIHRDLKPSNIFVTRRGQVKVLDFGLALLIVRHSPADRRGSTHHYGHSIEGTAPYMSPEQARGDDLDARSDLFSLGIVLYEMATGLRPFNGSSRREVQDAIVTRDAPPPSSMNARLPPELDRIIIKALEKNRSFRFQSASDLRTDLLRLKRDLEGPVARPAPVPREPNTSGRWPAAALLSIVIFAAAIFALKKNEGQIATIPSTPIGPRSFAGPRLGAAIRPPVKPIDRVARPAPAAAPAVAAATAAPATAAPATAPAAAPTVAPAAAPTVAAARESSAAQELRIARVKADAGLHTQALATLRELVAKYTGSEEAVDAYFLIARIHERQEQPEDALATYLEIASRYEHHPRAPEAMFRFAQTTIRSPRKNKAAEARRMLAEVADRYPSTEWAARSLLEKGELEDRERYVEQDARMNATVPAALVTYRRLVETYPHSFSTERALAHLGEIYQRLKRFDLAAETFVKLGSAYPHASHDAWFRAGEIYRRQLRDTARARDAYARVPVTSPHFADAQKQLK